MVREELSLPARGFTAALELGQVAPPWASRGDLRDQAARLEPELQRQLQAILVERVRTQGPARSRTQRALLADLLRSLVRAGATEDALRCPIIPWRSPAGVVRLRPLGELLAAPSPAPVADPGARARGAEGLWLLDPEARALVTRLGGPALQAMEDAAPRPLARLAPRALLAALRHLGHPTPVATPDPELAELARRLEALLRASGSDLAVRWRRGAAAPIVRGRTLWLAPDHPDSRRALTARDPRALHLALRLLLLDQPSELAALPPLSSALVGSTSARP